MWPWLADAPRWKRAVVLGLGFGGFMTLFSVLTERASWVGAALGGVVGGLLFGVIASRTLFPQEAEFRAAMDAVRAAGRWRVSRVTWGGRVPDDPAARSAAAAMIAYQLSLLERQRRWGAPFFLVMILAAGALAMTTSRWYWAAVALFAAALVSQLVLPDRLRRRAERLRNADG